MTPDPSTHEGFYRRPLPAELIAFASDEGRGLFAEALARGGMEGYFRLAEQLHTQSDPTFCGLASLVVTLNALGMDPGRLWKGPWRWFGEEMLDCCVPLDVVRREGVTISQLACLARCNGASVALRRASEHTVDVLRDDIARALRGRDGPFVIASYSRAALGQTGDGHFSPVGGWHQRRDLALILDVARFKYPPHWTSLERLHAAMLRADAATGTSRGWLVVERGEGPSTLRYAVDCRHEPWPTFVARLDALGKALTRVVPGSLGDAVASLLAAAQPLSGCIAKHGAELDALPAPHRAQVDELLAALRASAAWRAVTDVGTAHDPDIAALVVLALPDAALGPLAGVLAPLRSTHLPDPLRAEVTRLREQLGLVRDLAAGA